MRRLALFLMVSSLFFASCEKDEGDKGCVKNIAFATSSSFVGVTGGLIEATKYKYMVIGETPNVSEANGKTYCDSTKSTEGFSFKAINLYANTKYYVKIYYRDASGKTIYSPEYTVTTDNSTTATTFNSVKKGDTLVDGKACHLLTYSFNTISDLRNADFGVCYGKVSEPTVNDNLVHGTLDEKGVVKCDMSVTSCYDSVTVRPYFKDAKGVYYGVAFKYAKGSWLNVGLFPGSARVDPGAITYKGKGYVFMGSDPNSDSKRGAITDLWCFDSQTLLWSKEVTFDNIIRDASNSGGGLHVTDMEAVPYSDGFILFKGYSWYGIWLDKFYTYNISSKQYSQILTNGIPDAIRKESLGYKGFFVNGQTYIALSMGSGTVYGKNKGTFIYRYNNTDKTFELETVNADRQGERLSVYFSKDNLIFFGGGAYYSGDDRLATDFWSYNVSTKVWTRLKDAPISKFEKSFVYKSRCFAIGYNDNKLYEYSIGNDSWTIVEKIPYSVEALMPFDDALYLFASQKKGDKYVNSVWKYAVL